jgi:predicted CXXCH cytochrome family protein
MGGHKNKRQYSVCGCHAYQFHRHPLTGQDNLFLFKMPGEVAKTYEESIHWQRLNEGRLEAATCTDCHGTHGILSSKNPESLTYVDNIPQTCASCHENQTKMQAWYYGIATDRFDTYKNSYHYKASISGGTGLATCSDCHESHDIRAPTDPNSRPTPFLLERGTDSYSRSYH